MNVDVEDGVDPSTLHCPQATHSSGPQTRYNHCQARSNTPIRWNIRYRSWDWPKVVRCAAVAVVGDGCDDADDDVVGAVDLGS